MHVHTKIGCMPDEVETELLRCYVTGQQSTANICLFHWTCGVEAIGHAPAMHKVIEIISVIQSPAEYWDAPVPTTPDNILNLPILIYRTLRCIIATDLI